MHGLLFLVNIWSQATVFTDLLIKFIKYMFQKQSITRFYDSCSEPALPVGKITANYSKQNLVYFIPYGKAGMTLTQPYSWYLFDDGIRMRNLLN